MTRYYNDHTHELRDELKERLDLDRIRELHRSRPLLHFVVLARQLALGALAVWAIVAFPQWWIWMPAAALLGLVVFDFTVLLHEVLHDNVFQKRRPFWKKVLGWAYALPSGISATQFSRWHLDHHAELGSEEEDPKRHHLTPKIVRRWYKLLYCTPALFPIYFRAAAREAATYPEKLQRQIRFERRVTLAAHLALLASLFVFAGPVLAVELYVVPVFFAFPVWFTLNRLGQHYDVHPEDPAAWATVMKPSRMWDFLFLSSNYHSEHHFFPRVPMYNLRRLHFALRPVYERHDLKNRTYRWLLWKWFVENRQPHTDWDEPLSEARSRPEAPAASDFLVG